MKKSVTEHLNQNLECVNVLKNQVINVCETESLQTCYFKIKLNRTDE